MSIIVEYLWLDANQHMRSKIRLLEEDQLGINIVNVDNDQKLELELESIPEWNFDGSSTGQSNVELSEIILKPVNLIKHPFQNKLVSSLNMTTAYLVLCECYTHEGKPAIGNSRYHMVKSFEKKMELEPWFGIEQEFFFFDKSTKLPVGWKGTEQTPQGEYYCGVNRCSPIEREIMDKFLKLCIKNKLKLCGINQEVAPCQWEYQIGILNSIETIDHLIFCKFILFKLCEEKGLYTVFHPKPLLGNWNGSGCHINISTKKTRENKKDTNRGSGYDEILQILSKMEKDHSNFIAEYCGRDNHMRLTGNHETSSPTDFTFSIGGRNTSIRIPYHVKNSGYGYFEDRRPGSSIDYYKTIEKYLNYID